MQDCWANRSSGMRCKTCIYFVAKYPSEYGNPLTHKDNKEPEVGVVSRGLLGRCRRNAPTMKGFVPVFESDWCGEHRLDENKI